MYLKLSSWYKRPFCLDLDVLRLYDTKYLYKYTVVIPSTPQYYRLNGFGQVLIAKNKNKTKKSVKHFIISPV